MSQQGRQWVQEPRVEWETGRTGEPLDFPGIVWQKLSALVASPLGSKDRHRHLQDLTDLLAHAHDDPFRRDIAHASDVRDETFRKAKENDGVIDAGELAEIIDAHQRGWLEAIMRLMKRRNLLGEDWVRG